MVLPLAITGPQVNGLLFLPVGIAGAVYCWRRGVPVTSGYRWTGLTAKVIAVLIVLVTVLGVLAVMFEPQIRQYIDRIDAQGRHPSQHGAP